MWNSHPWRHPKPGWTWPWATWARFQAGAAVSRWWDWMTSRGAFQPKLFYFSNKNDCETMLSGAPVSTRTAGLHLTLQRNLPLLLTAWLQRLFPKTLSPPRKVSSPSSSGMPQQSQHKASRQPPSWLPRRRLCQSAAHSMHTGNKQIWWTICRAPSTPQPWQAACTPPWCCLGSTQACSTAQDWLCFSPQRLQKFLALIMISVGIHVAALISLELPVIKTR